jgi:hypothetical protein
MTNFLPSSSFVSLISFFFFSFSNLNLHQSEIVHSKKKEEEEEEEEENIIKGRKEHLTNVCIR